MFGRWHKKFPMTKRTERLVRQAAVMGFVNGTHHATGRDYHTMMDDFPKDSKIISDVIRGAESNCDLYKDLSKVEFRDLGHGERCQFCGSHELESGHAYPSGKQFKLCLKCGQADS